MLRPARLYFPVNLHKTFENGLPKTEKIACSQRAGYWPDKFQLSWELFVLKNGYRLVRNRSRAQRLAKRGERMHWSDHLKGWIWSAGSEGDQFLKQNKREVTNG